MTEFLYGALAMGSATAGLLFWRSWRDVKDRLFVYFALAFWVFAAHWVALGLLRQGLEEPYRLYVLRLVTFALILAGILDKNRSGRRSSRPR